MVGQNIGKYRVLDRIGRGGMGTVYRAIDETLHREVAIKVLNAELNDPEVAKRFRAEAITVARLSHPGIATIYELFQHDGQWLMVMEFVRGETLERLVERTGAQAPERGAELCMQSLAALAHAHSMGVVHRDLKPANIMVTESGTVKIMDFGIARVTGTEHLTNVGFMMGTPAYMAPEQVLGQDIDARADIYAMGVVFYRLVSAQLPFKGDTPFAMAQAQVNSPPTPIGSVRQDLPGWVDEIMRLSLAKKPEERFQSAVEFHEGFARSLAGEAMPTAYSSSAPTGLMMTPPKAVPTGTLERPLPGSSTPKTGTAMSPGIGPSGAVPTSASDIAPTIAALTPAALLRPPTESLTMSATSAMAAAGAGAAAAPAARPSIGSAEAGVGPPVPLADSTLTSEPAKKSSIIPIAVAAGVVLIAVSGFFVWRSTRSPAPPVETAPVVTLVDPAASAAPGSGPMAASGATTPPAPAAPPPALAPGSTVSPPSATVTGTVPGRAGDPLALDAAGRRGDPAAARGTLAAGARRGAPPPVTDELLAFTDVRVLVVDGKRSRDEEVLLNFVGGQIALVARRAGTTMASVPYPSVASATFARARDPKWNTAFSSPPEGLDVGGILRTPKHWLTLQTRDSYFILRLADTNVSRVIAALEARTGITVERPNTSNERN